MALGQLSRDGGVGPGAAVADHGNGPGHRTFAQTKGEAQEAYRHFVRDGIGTDSVWGALKHQIYLGDAPFVERKRRREGARDEIQIPKPKRHAQGGRA